MVRCFTVSLNFLYAKLLTVLCWICLTVTVSSNTSVASFRELRRLDGVKCQLHATETFPSREPDLIGCALRCSTKTECQVANYYSVNSECWLSYSMLDTESLVNAQDWTVVYKRHQIGFDGCNNGSCYIVVTGAMSWNQSKVYCERTGGHLADIKSLTEMDFVGSVVNNNPNSTQTDLYYTGGFDHGNGTVRTFRWSDGSLLDDHFTFWATGEPNNIAGTQEYCLQFHDPKNTNNSLRWNDSACHEPFYAVCEYE